MNAATPEIPRRYLLISWTIRVVIFAILLAALGPVLPQIVAYGREAGFHPHWLDVNLFTSIPAVVKFHIVAAVASFLIGCIILFRPKGRGLHKILGWSWVIAMSATAGSSFFITGLNGNNLSLIHLISGWTVVALPAALFAIRNKRVMIHSRIMTSLFVGGLLVAGALTFLPGRLMYQLFFG